MKRYDEYGSDGHARKEESADGNFVKPAGEEGPNDWLLTSLLMSAAVGHVLDEGVGVCVELKGKMCELAPDLKKVVVLVDGERVVVSPCTDEENEILKDGQIVQVTVA